MLYLPTSPKERFALENLERQDFTAYCPMHIKRIGRRNKGQADVARPLFPGYVFIEVTPERSHWRPILSTYGVRNLIRMGGDIASVDSRFVSALKLREIDGVVARPEVAYAIGDNVTIAGGPFDGIVATILSMDEKDRLIVLMQVLNRPVKVQMQARQVSPLLPAVA